MVPTEEVGEEGEEGDFEDDHLTQGSSKGGWQRVKAIFDVIH